MMVSVLTQLGLETRKPAEEILEHLLPREKVATEWRKGQQLLGKSPRTSDIVSRNAGRIAIEVASNLGICGILQRGALHADQSLRTESVRYSYNLWQRDPDRGFVILEELARQAVDGFLPNLLALESTFGLSSVIFFEHYQDQSILARLQNIWRGIIATLLHIREGNSHQEGVIQAFLRERIFSFVSGVAFRLLRDVPANDVFDTYQLEAFFHISAEEKKLYRRLVRYINISDLYAIEQMKYDYFQAIKKNYLLFIAVTEVGLVARSCHTPLSFLPFIKELFDEAKSDQAAYTYLGQITYVLENILNRNILSGEPVLDEIFKFFIEAVETSQEYYIRNPASLAYPASEVPQTLFLGPYTLRYHYKTGIVKTPLLEMRIQNALASNNLLFCNQLITVELNFIAILWRKPRIALEVLKLFSNSGHPEIDEMIQAFLSRLKVRYPD